MQSLFGGAPLKTQKWPPSSGFEAHRPDQGEGAVLPFFGLCHLYILMFGSRVAADLRCTSIHRHPTRSRVWFSGHSDRTSSYRAICANGHTGRLSSRRRPRGRSARSQTNRPAFPGVLAPRGDWLDCVGRYGCIAARPVCADRAAARIGSRGKASAVGRPRKPVLVREFCRC